MRPAASTAVRALIGPSVRSAGSNQNTVTERSCRWVRRRRRIAAGGAAAMVVAAAVLGIGHLPGRLGRAPVPAASVSATARPVPPRVSGALGDAIDTRITAGRDHTWVLYANRVRDPSAPGTTFGLTIARHSTGGRTTDPFELHEDEGSDRAAGFHPMQAPMTYENGLIQPAFGYYVGAATRITGRSGGGVVTARIATWSVDTTVAIFWFEPIGESPEDVTDLVAYDAAGTELPAGNPRIWNN